MATLQLNQTNCEKVQCGAIPASVLNLASNDVNGLPFASACTAAGFGGPLGGRYCDDPVCAPFKEAILTSGWGQGLECCVEEGGTWNANNTCTMPSMTTATMPTVTGTAAKVAAPQAPALTPTLLTQKLPSIVNPAPAVLAPACSDDFATWVNNNALLVMGGLGLLAYLILDQK
jgi:hypothetical protein